MNILLVIVILILMLGIIISAHEAGHLAVAKAFNVYCLEYSIGFGPKIFRKKRKNGETYFALRTIPLGGYVSMYGEGVELPSGVTIPPERSLEGIAKWKRALILVAGIVVNLFLSLLFVMIYSTCYPSIKTYDLVDTGLTNSSGEDVSVVAFTGSLSGSVLSYDEDNDAIYSPGTIYGEGDYSSLGGFVIDTQVSISGHSGDYVALYYPSSSTSNDLVSCLTFYQAESDYTPSSLRLSLGVYNLPDFSAPYSALEGDVATMSVYAMTKGDLGSAEFASRRAISFTTTAVTDGSAVAWSTNGLSIVSETYWLPLGTRILNGFASWGNFFTLIGKGIASLFMGNLSDIGGVVAMGAGISQLSSYMGIGRTFFFYGGFLSLNLAIFNFLPFPGLDGWGLLVTGIEGMTRKKIPEKTKNIVSMVGLAILFLLAIFITIKDILTFVV
jgi:membrane-associated protease RseP (regulator of RpoE activity)